MCRLTRLIAGAVLGLLTVCRAALAAGPAPTPGAAGPGVAVAYQLPTDGPLPRTYRVTLAIVDRKNPDWIVSQFACGVPQTVTAENQGKFTATWDGLDDNFMPVPPGEYGVKGIYMPADRWAVDGEYHSVTPRFAGGISAWLPTPDQWNKPEPFGGDPCDAPLTDVAVNADGVAVFYYAYLENGLNCPLIDLKKPLGLGQFIRAFNSGGAAGGTAAVTDGKMVWAFSTNGGQPTFVYRGDERPFGTGSTLRSGVYIPDGFVKAMALTPDPRADGASSYIYVAQGGKCVVRPDGEWGESTTDLVDQITVHEGDGGKIVRRLPVRHLRSIAIAGDCLYALHDTADDRPVVSSTSLKDGLPNGDWQPALIIPAAIHAIDFKIDSHGKIYLSDREANHVYQVDRQGKVVVTYGKEDHQKPGAYDPLTLMSPGKIAVWKDADGADRLMITEQAGPNRVSEWSAEGKLLREFPSLQTRANDGYAVDPDHPEMIYVVGQRNCLLRFRFDDAKHQFTTDAVWPEFGTDPATPGLDHPKFIRVDGRAYLAGARSYNIYRQDGDQWVLSAAIIRKRNKDKVEVFAWSDANGDGRVQDEECHPLPHPEGVFRYHGEQWLDDLSLLAVGQGTRDIWRLAPDTFDGKGNPVFRRWTRVLSDPVFAARAEGKVDATHGGNELDDQYSSDWALADGVVGKDVYVQARGGKSFSANDGAQVKVSRYVPDGKGGYKLKWRTGRTPLGRVALPGEIYGAIHLHQPINGLLSVVDQSRCGVLLFTEDGLYVDSIFADGRKFTPAVAGVYPQPGEFFAGMIFRNRRNGKIYFGMGKYTPMLFEAQGWSLKDNPAHPLTTVQPTVSITASQIASPPEIALSVRGGAGAARVARFGPALGGAVLDGSMAGWESCEAITFSADKEQTVEVRCQYDPEHLYLRWHARLGHAFEPTPLQPIDRIFTHDRLADTLSFYLQGDPAAPAGGPSVGRDGDIRIVFGIFADGGNIAPAALAMYPKYRGTDKASPLTYATAAGGKATFEHVAALVGAEMHGVVDLDKKGFVIAASIPRAAIPGPIAFAGSTRTMANFSATFAGHSKFWWSNSDGSASRETYDEPTEARLYPSSWAPAQFQGLKDGIVVRNWLTCGPFGGPGAEKFREDANPDSMKQAVHAFSQAAHYPPDDGRINFKATYTGDMVRGYWPDPHEVTWTRKTVADLDTRIVLGPSGQVWYGATWIYTPTETELNFRLQGHPQTYLKFALNGVPVSDGEIRHAPGQNENKPPEASKPVKLRRGWNEVTFRGFCVGYPPFRAGLVLDGAPEKLWSLRLSATPPTTN